jgi:hypothetical protein
MVINTGYYFPHGQHHRPPPLTRSNVLPMTLRLLNNMALTAISGDSNPLMANGILMML